MIDTITFDLWNTLQKLGQGLYPCPERRRVGVQPPPEQLVTAICKFGIFGKPAELQHQKDFEI